jgi:hypothetical protein
MAVGPPAYSQLLFANYTVERTQNIACISLLTFQHRYCVHTYNPPFIHTIYMHSACVSDAERCNISIYFWSVDERTENLLSHHAYSSVRHQSVSNVTSALFATCGVLCWPFLHPDRKSILSNKKPSNILDSHSLTLPLPRRCSSCVEKLNSWIETHFDKTVLKVSTTYNWI